MRDLNAGVIGIDAHFLGPRTPGGADVVEKTGVRDGVLDLSSYFQCEIDLDCEANDRLLGSWLMLSD